MASIRYLNHRKRWEVRKHITDPQTGKISRLDRTLPKNSTRLDAERIAAEMDRLAVRIKYGRMRTPDKIQHAVNTWLSLMRQHTPRTLDLYTRQINRFIAALPPQISHINHIQPIHISDFVASVFSCRSAATANRYLTAIKSFCRWYSRQYGLPNPAAAVDMLPEPDPDSRFLSEPEYARILDAVQLATADWFSFLAHTGLRASEFCGLLWSNIAADGQSLHLRGKGRKIRVIPLNEVCRQILQRLRQPQTSPDNYIFISKSRDPAFTGKPRTRMGLYGTCRGVARRLKIQSFGPHAFRHYFATQLLLRGVPILQVSLLLGHSSVTTTQKRYTHILPDHLRGITECLSRPLVLPGEGPGI